MREAKNLLDAHLPIKSIRIYDKDIGVELEVILA